MLEFAQSKDYYKQKDPALFKKYWESFKDTINLMKGSEINQHMGVVESVQQANVEVVAPNHQAARLVRGQTGTFIFTITNKTKQAWSSDSKLVPFKDCLNYKGLDLALGA